LPDFDEDHHANPPDPHQQNHRAALAEIEKLWGACTGTPEGDKLDILVTLVETYEERRWPLRSRRRFDPVDVLRYAIEELGHSQAELADISARVRGRPKSWLGAAPLLWR
jgi:HTH-type transcriptional regulator / antitoxin HigA